MRQQDSALHDNLISKWVLFGMLFLSFTTSTTEKPDEDNYYPFFNNRKISTVGASSYSDSESTYSVIFDAGSSGSRVHVFRFNDNLDLLLIRKKIEVFERIRPGVSEYPDNPERAAATLISLLNIAEKAVPPEFHPTTPLRLGATAGLRLLKRDKAERILQAVRKLFKSRSSLKYEKNAVSILRGSQEGSYLWVATNYLLGNLGKKYSNTVGVVDLGGASVQMAHAISKEAAAKAPKLPDNEDEYVQNFHFKGTTYHIYVHSYLNYGARAARAEILKVTKDSANPCILAGYHGSYKYNGKVYKASASPFGSSFSHCRRVILEALKVNKPCNYTACTFNGIWNGGGGDGQNNLYLASSFYKVPSRTDFIDPKKPEARVRPTDFKKVAERACRTKFVDAKTAFPNFNEEDLRFVCMDLVYEYTLLVDGFGVDPRKEVTLVKKIKYRDSKLVKVAWPLGNALAEISSLSYLDSSS